MLPLSKLRGVLETVCPNVSRVESIGEAFPRIVYAEYGWTDEGFDNQGGYGRYMVEVNLYTLTIDGNGMFEALKTALAQNNVPFAVEGIDHGTLQDRKKVFEGVTWYRFICEVFG